IRDFHVTGVQTCALPISRLARDELTGAEVPRVELGFVEGVESPARDRGEVERGGSEAAQVAHLRHEPRDHLALACAPLGVVREETGRASCRERASIWWVP